MEADLIGTLGTASSFLVMVYIYITGRKEHKDERSAFYEMMNTHHNEMIISHKETDTVLKNLTVAVERLKPAKK